MDIPERQGSQRVRAVSEMAAAISLLPKQVDFEIEWESVCKNQFLSMFEEVKNQAPLFASRIYKWVNLWTLQAMLKRYGCGYSHECESWLANSIFKF